MELAFMTRRKFRRFTPIQPTRSSSVVTRPYTEALGRSPNAAHVDGWTSYIVATDDALGAANTFFSSSTNRGTARMPAQQVTVVYRVLLGFSYRAGCTSASTPSAPESP